MERIGRFPFRIHVPAPSPGPAPGAVLGILRSAESLKTTIGENAAPSPSPVPAQEARGGKRPDPAPKGGPEMSSPRASVNLGGAPFLGTRR
jgi:hypothetical protein